MAAESPVITRVRKFTGWYIFAAVLFMVLGLAAIIEPATAAVGVVLLLGWLLILGAVAHLLATFKGGDTRRVLFQLFSAIVFALGGVYLLSHQLLAIGALTALLAAVIFVAGVFDIVTYFRLGREHPSGWILLNGIVALVLAGLIWSQWPSSSAWAIGTLVGVNLLMTGTTRLMFALVGRRLIKPATT
jgi:uncharacterized membrane protein HdeD (DUF308 family)